MRFDLQTLVVMLAAVGSSLGAAWAMERWGGPGTAEAAPIAVVAEPAAQGRPTQIVRSTDGHYWAEADIDGRAVRVLVDTGASYVALTRDDALRLGVDPRPEAFVRPVQTASGQARAAAVTLERVAVAGAVVEDVPALVVEAGLSHSLLGMSYLGALSGFEATPSGLTLKP